MAMTLEFFLGRYARQGSDLIDAATRALNAYADTAAKPDVQVNYTITNTGTGLTSTEVQRRIEQLLNPMQKGSD